MLKRLVIGGIIGAGAVIVNFTLPQAVFLAILAGGIIEYVGKNEE